ncbi:Bowman-Birk type proteinase inhibitor-like [Prosopis cineraria]|uniref:Bowman-Birk type proteinase inhibitor-like n=1 Tax=Prosopis cineraria TaxID=364024 RepID=UPI0024106FA9|nr:Bowman-Birk type proteinase inhibitor-like [Prosopis cineraria]
MRLKVGMVLFLTAFLAAATVESRFDPNTLLLEMVNEKGEPNYVIKSTTDTCCDNCTCDNIESEPFSCVCLDITQSCHSACKGRACTLSIPQQCRCLDTTYGCDDKCSSSVKSQIAN